MIRITPAPLPRVQQLPWWLGGTILLWVVVSLTMLRPLRSAIQATDAEIESLQAEIAARAHPPDQDPLDLRLQREMRTHQRWVSEWERHRERIGDLRVSAGLAEILTTSIEGRIDFKVALFEARQRLGRTARARGVALPADLGIPDTIGTDEDTELRLGQLVATVLLLERCLAHDIARIESVTPHSPRIISIEEEPVSQVAFYPVTIQLTTTYETLLELLRALREDEMFFGLRRFLVMNEFPDIEGPLTVKMQWNVIALTTPLPRAQRALPEEESDNEDDWLFY